MAVRGPDGAAAPADGSARAGHRRAVKDLASQTSTLVRQEIQLAQAEVTQKGKMAGKGAGCWRAGMSGCSALGP